MDSGNKGEGGIIKEHFCQMLGHESAVEGVTKSSKDDGVMPLIYVQKIQESGEGTH